MSVYDIVSFTMIIALYLWVGVLSAKVDVVKKPDEKADKEMPDSISRIIGDRYRKTNTLIDIDHLICFIEQQKKFIVYDPHIKHNNSRLRTLQMWEDLLKSKRTILQQYEKCKTVTEKQPSTMQSKSIENLVDVFTAIHSDVELHKSQIIRLNEKKVDVEIDIYNRLYELYAVDGKFTHTAFSVGDKVIEIIGNTVKIQDIKKL